jgi:CheY-like chemotaxis protein
MTQLAFAQKNPRLLVLEDELVVRKALRKYFSAAGFVVDCARELEEAQALIVTSKYALVIADLRLSWSYSVEGLEILRFVRQHSRDTRVIILTAYAAPDIQRSARALGADAFLHKPVPLPDIAAAVHRLTGEAR